MDNPSFSLGEGEGPVPEAETETVVAKKPTRSESKKVRIQEHHVVNGVAIGSKDDPVRNPQRSVILNPLSELLGNSLSFFMITKYFACCPTMTLIPVQMSSGDSSAESDRSAPHLITSQSRRCWNWLCCCIRPLNTQEVRVFSQSNSEILSFIFEPHVWCPAPAKKERLVNVFIPGMEDRLGWINAARDVGSGSEIHCKLTQQTFVTREVVDKTSPRCFKIENSVGLEVASGKVISSSWWGNVWSGFQFDFVPSELDTLSHATRALLMVAFMLWVTDAREKKQWSYIWSILFILFLAGCYLLIVFFGPKDP